MRHHMLKRLSFGAQLGFGPIPLRVLYFYNLTPASASEGAAGYTESVSASASPGMAGIAGHA